MWNFKIINQPIIYCKQQPVTLIQSSLINFEIIIVRTHYLIRNLKLIKNLKSSNCVPQPANFSKQERHSVEIDQPMEKRLKVFNFNKKNWKISNETITCRVEQAYMLNLWK